MYSQWKCKIVLLALCLMKHDMKQCSIYAFLKASRFKMFIVSLVHMHLCEVLRLGGSKKLIHCNSKTITTEYKWQ